MLKRSIFAVALALICTGSLAQGASPYAGQESRDIKSLSPDEIDSYLSGKGMGLAKAAELNGFPGPMHVLELERQLALTADQRALTQALFASMQARAWTLGQALIDEERKLDRLFATKAITPGTLNRALAEIGGLQAQIRAAHLESHLAQTEILTPEQVVQYATLRGYGSGGHDGHRGNHKH
jgi:Spy/CpxP family protein refolding chaperone